MSGNMPAVSPALADSPAVDPNAPTPQEIAEFEAQEKADAAAQTNAVVAPAPVDTPSPPAPVAEPTPAPVVAAQAVPEPAPVDPNAPTPQERAEFEAQEKADTAGPKIINPVTDMTAEELADMVIQDPTFNLEAEFRKNLPHRLGAFGKQRLDATLAEVQEYRALKEKFATADHMLRERGFQAEDIVGGLKQAPGMVVDLVTGLAKYAKPFLASAAGSIQPTPEQKAKEQRDILEGAAATEASLTGLAGLAKQTAGKISRRVGNSKQLSEYTIDEKVKVFDDKMKRGEVQEATLSGHGPVMQLLGPEAILQTEAAGLPLRPEEVAAKSAGDPFAIYAFGKAFGPVGKVIGKVVPAPIKALGRQAMAGAEALVPEVVGKVIEYGAKAISGTAKVAEKAAPIVGGIAGAIKGAEMGGIPGGIAGAGIGAKGGETIARGIAGVRGVAEKVAGLGEQVSGTKPMVSSYAQFVRSVAESAPGAVVAAGEGLAMDIGLAALSSESPQDTQGAINIGTAIGFGKGLAGMAKKMTSGQIVSPRSYGVNAPVQTPRPMREAFPALASMHDAAYGEKTPQERANINASRKLTADLKTDATLFVGKDATTVEKALVDSGVPSERAKTLSEAEGFFTVELEGADGKLHKVIVVRNVAAAPHEVKHALQAVLGEPANRVLDETIKRDYADVWEQEGNKYADRLGENPQGKSWEERILNASGWGRVELVDKMTRELTASNEAHGNPPNPTLIKRLVMAEITRLQKEKGGDPQNVWNGELSAEEAKIIADRYVARELGAEAFDVAVKNLGIGLQEGKTLPQRMARIAAAIITGLGGDPLAGTRSEIGGIQPRMATLEAVKKAARGRFTETKPGESLVTPRSAPPSSPVGRPGAPGKGIPTTPEQIAEAASAAQQVADAAPDTVAPGASASPRELLGTVAEAIASRDGIKINYRSAPGEPAAATTGNRTARRAVVEAFRTMPEAARALWEKNFFPERVILTKGGKYQISGWAPEVFASNAHKIAKALIDARKGDLAPYPLDPTTGSFTSEGWQRLYEDTQTFVENQVAGRTGSGEELVVPRSVVDAGGYKPPVVGEAKPLEQGAADFINMLFNFRIPDTPRMVAGKRPLNIQGQEVSAATIPGRLEQPTRTRAPFEGQEAVAQGIVGREILEVNPTRGAIERALGEQMPSLNDVRQNLNLEHINDVTIAPEQPQFRGNTLTLSAGMQAPRGDRGVQFQPQTETGRKFEKEGFLFRIAHPEKGAYTIEVMRNNEQVAVLESSLKDDKTASIDWVRVIPEFRKQGLSEAMYRELAARLQKSGIETLTGTVIAEGPGQTRRKLFGEPEIVPVPELKGSGAIQVNSRIDPKVQFSPKRWEGKSTKDSVDEILAMPADSWVTFARGYRGAHSQAATGIAIDIGKLVKTPEDLLALKVGADIASERYKVARAAGDIDTAMAEATRGQAFNEAIQTYEDSSPVLKELQKKSQLPRE